MRSIIQILSAAAAISVNGFAADLTSARIHVTVEERSTPGEPLPCLVFWRDAAGKSLRAEGLPFWRDHFASTGKFTLDLPAGRYSYEIERGPEYSKTTGQLAVAAGAPEQRLTVTLDRIVDLQKLGWWPGDLHVHRPIDEIELLMRAEELYVAPVITWWNNRNLWAARTVPARRTVQFDRNRFYEVLGGEDERGGGALLYFHLDTPLQIGAAAREFPPMLRFLKEARTQPAAWIDIEKPFWWDVPVWLALGQADSIGLLNNHVWRDGMLDNEAWGHARDKSKFPSPLGNGYWSQEIYYQILNCGFRIPPSAGSASGVLPNPAGYNRVYVEAGPQLEPSVWWRNLKRGRSFVSNGPLLLARANDQLPGVVFQLAAGKPLSMEIAGDLISRDPIDRIELIRDGKIERTIRQPGGRFNFGKVEFARGGWFLVRVIGEDTKTFRFASTGPFYVEEPTQQPVISRASVQFFIDWVRERAEGVRLPDATQQAELLADLRAAERFWMERLAKANRD